MIFLSYSRLNKEVYQLETELRQAGIPYMRDPDLVEGDPFWRHSIRTALESCTMLVVVWSKEASESPYINQEIRAFTKEIIFVTLDETKTPLVNGQLITPRQTIPVLRRSVKNRIRAKVVNLADDTRIIRVRKDRVIDESKRLRVFKRRFSRSPKLINLDQKIINSLDGTELKKEGNFWLAVDPVTNLQYKKFVEATGYSSPPTWMHSDFSSPLLPVTGVTWFEAQAYAAWVGGTLPDEAEWESAARGNTDFLYATSTGRLEPSLAHFGFGLGEGAPCLVDMFPPNPGGFRGMCGNVWDWCINQWSENYMIKGGGFMDDEPFCKIPSRYRNLPIDRDCCVGFRVKIMMDESLT